MALAAIAFLAPTLAHVVVETPAHQHDTWVNHPEINLLGISSPLLGDLANAVPVLLSAVAFGAVVAFAREWGSQRG